MFFPPLSYIFAAKMTTFGIIIHLFKKWYKGTWEIYGEILYSFQNIFS